MKIEVRDHTIKDLIAGDVFYYEGDLYVLCMKTVELSYKNSRDLPYIAVRLVDGFIDFFSPNAEVSKRDVALVDIDAIRKEV